MTRQCVFCGKNEVTREHVWPQWIQDEMHARFGKSDWTVRRAGGGHTSAKLNATVKRACEPCNTKWMSAIEGRTKPLLTPLMFGERKSTPLSPETQKVLATWAFKTMLTANFLFPGSDVPETTYSRFFTERVPPNHCTIWTGAYSGSRLRLLTSVRAASFQSALGFNRDGVLVRQPSRVPGTTGTLVAIRAVFQVMLHEGVSIPMTSQEEGHLLWRIWPPNRKTLPWPPEARAMGDDALTEFLDQVEAFRRSGDS